MLISEAAHHYFDALDFHDLEALESLLSEDFQMTGNVTQVLDRRGVLTLYESYFAAFSDFAFNFNDASQKDNMLRVKYQITGTHDGILDLTPLGIAITVEPTDQQITLPESLCELVIDENDRIAEAIMHQAEGSTMTDLLSQLGIEMPPLG